MPIALAEVVETLAHRGYAVAPDVLAPATVAQLRRDLEDAIEREAAFHGGNQYVDYGMVLVCCTHARSFVDVLAETAVTSVIERVLGSGCIVYAYTSSSMPPQRSNFSHRIHVDSPRLIPGYETNAGVMLLLDDFTADNGATWVLPGSQHRPDPPSEEYFFANAERVIAPAGSAVYLNPRVWHSGGRNHTDAWRHSITVNFCRPYMKQRLDIPTMMATSGVDLNGVADKAMQKLGFHAQVPASLAEYYAPPEQRKFRQRAE
jgi:ectoine hydroxylase-related dioxygenase (phytanoyl-CoA dioxygenase family)